MRNLEDVVTHSQLVIMATFLVLAEIRLLPFEKVFQAETNIRFEYNRTQNWNFCSFVFLVVTFNLLQVITLQIFDAVSFISTIQ